jgi:DnaJ family protein C protein 17
MRSHRIARLFHELTQAHELLLDPLRRMALDAMLRSQEARKQRYANFDKKRKGLVDELEEAERAAREAKSTETKKKQKYAQEAEQIRDAGRRMVEKRQADLRRQQEEAEQAEKSAREELEPPPLGVYLSLYRSIVTVHAKLVLIDIPGERDTTVRIHYKLPRYPQLTTPGALQTFMSSTFGPVDGDSIAFCMKSPKKKPPYANAAVPFKTISDAHAAVCASGRADRGLDGFKIKWMDGSEPAVWSWAERMLKLKEKEQRDATTTTTVPAMPAPAGGARDVGDDTPAVSPTSIGNNARGGLPQDSGAQSSPATSRQFSSFPSSFVRSHILALFLLCES